MGSITFVIKKGQVHIDVLDVHDASCMDISKAFEQALGIVEDVQRKPEYYAILDDMQQKVTFGDEE